MALAGGRSGTVGASRWGGRIMAGQAPRTPRELEAELIERAAKDEAFRRALLADPKGTIDRELGVQVPEGVALTVVEETPGSRYLVLPPRPPSAGHELHEL